MDDLQQQVPHPNRRIELKLELGRPLEMGGNTNERGNYEQDHDDLEPAKACLVAPFGVPEHNAECRRDQQQWSQLQRLLPMLKKQKLRYCAEEPEQEHADEPPAKAFDAVDQFCLELLGDQRPRASFATIASASLYLPITSLTKVVTSVAFGLSAMSARSILIMLLSIDV